MWRSTSRRSTTPSGDDPSSCAPAPMTAGQAWYLVAGAGMSYEAYVAAGAAACVVGTDGWAGMCPCPSRGGV